MLNRFIKATAAFCLLTGFAFSAIAQNEQPKQTTENKKPEQKQEQKIDLKNLTAEQVAEGVIYSTGGLGGRATLNQVRSKGVEQGRFRRTYSNTQPEEYTYTRRFLRGEDMNKDRIRIDQKSPSLDYALVFSQGNVWGVLGDTIFPPRPDITRTFNHLLWYSIDSLLRYKENGSTLNLVGKDKQNGVELYALEVIDKQNRKIRYYISAKLFRVIWLEYDEPLTENGTPVKYMKRFYDYRVAQGTVVPFRAVLFENGQQIEESHISTITYGLKVDEGVFDNPNIPKQNP